MDSTQPGIVTILNHDFECFQSSAWSPNTVSLYVGHSVFTGVVLHSQTGLPFKTVRSVGRGRLVVRVMDTKVAGGRDTLCSRWLVNIRWPPLGAIRSRCSDGV